MHICRWVEDTSTNISGKAKFTPDVAIKYHLQKLSLVTAKASKAWQLHKLLFADKKGIIYSQKICRIWATGIKSYIYTVHEPFFFPLYLLKSIFGLFFPWPSMSETLFSCLQKSFVWTDNQCFLLHQLETLKQPSTAICHNALTSVLRHHLELNSLFNPT